MNECVHIHIQTLCTIMYYMLHTSYHTLFAHNMYYAPRTKSYPLPWNTYWGSIAKETHSKSCKSIDLQFCQGNCQGNRQASHCNLVLSQLLPCPPLLWTPTIAPERRPGIVRPGPAPETAQRTSCSAWYIVHGIRCSMQYIV